MGTVPEETVFWGLQNTLNPPLKLGPLCPGSGTALRGPMGEAKKCHHLPDRTPLSSLFLYQSGPQTARSSLFLHGMDTVSF